MQNGQNCCKIFIQSVRLIHCILVCYGAYVCIKYNLMPIECINASADESLMLLVIDSDEGLTCRVASNGGGTDILKSVYLKHVGNATKYNL